MNSLAKLQALNSTLPEGNSVTLRAESLPDLTRHMDILKGNGWEVDGPGSVAFTLEGALFIQKMKKKATL